MVTRTKKIFVGGLSAPTTLEDVKNYFEQFGPVSRENIILIIHKTKYLSKARDYYNNIIIDTII